MNAIKLVKMHKDAVLPTSSGGNVGFDLHSVISGRIMPGETVMVHTGLRLADNPYWQNNISDVVNFLKIEGRSGLASKSIFPVGGIIDPSYRGEICVLLHNGRALGMGDPNKAAYDIQIGDRIAQLVLYAACSTSSVHPSFVKESDVTVSDRGDSGFGSSGR